MAATSTHSLTSPAAGGEQHRSEAMPERRLRGIVVTNLYATPAEPARAMFNQQQFRALSAFHDLVIAVPRAVRYPCAVNASFEPETRDAPRVVHFDAWEPPILGRLSNAGSVARAATRALASELGRRKPDYVLGSFAYPDGAAAVMLGRSLNVPAFVKVHGTDVNVMARSWAVGRQIQWALRHAAGVIAVSRALADEVDALGARSAETLLLYNGVDRALFQPQERSAARRSLQLPAGRRSVLYVGNLKRDKGVVDLANAFAAIAPRHPDVDLEVLGTGAARAELVQLRRRYRLDARIQLRGARQHEEVAAWLAACDLLCLPSHAEGVPNVVLEALAAGRPVVATRVGGIPEVVAESAGRLVAARDIEALSAALSDVLTRSWDPMTLSRGVPALGWADNAARLAEFIATQCARRPAASA
jgi:glycosyltransferase involved in cell wall biosynthesis